MLNRSKFKSNMNQVSQDMVLEADLNKKYGALVVLGKNWKEYPPKNLPKNWQIQLSVDSKMSSLAAGEMFKRGNISKIIFSSGKTAGNQWLSEAEAMWKYTKRKFPMIPDQVVILEEDSIDTAGNAEKVGDIIQKYEIQNIALLTVDFHLARSKKIFMNRGMKVDCFASEQVLQECSPAYLDFVRQYKMSTRLKLEKAREAILNVLFYIDPKAKISRILAKKFRHV